MGSWGTGLYQDDVAVDLKDTIKLLAKLPASGDDILQILLENHDEGVSFEDDGGPTFWLVVADQFERRGIACTEAINRALAAIDGGADLRDFERRDASPGDLRKRGKTLDALAERLRSPRPMRPRPTGTRPSPFVVDVGQLYRFPTMDYEAFNPWFPTWEAADFKPDGWGALLVIALGRVFDWFPWCAASSLTVSPTRAPTLEDVLKARFISEQQSGSYFVPRRTHLKRMRMDLIGQLSLDTTQVAAAMPRENSPQFAVLAGWSFAPEARSWRGTSEGGVAVADLLTSP
jgi:hypothetical protein